MLQIPSCQICFNQIQLVTINCSHVFCESCIQNWFFDSKIQQFKNFNCPKCNLKINFETLYKYIPDNLHNDEFILKFEIAQCAAENEKFIECQTNLCFESYFVWKDADYFKCIKCKNEYCLKCQQFNHKPKTCIEQLRLNSFNKSRIKFMLQIEQNENNQICPNCLMAVEKTGGCNFMTCKSDLCRGQKYFCFKCGVILNQNDSVQHYMGSDAYAGECKILLNGKWEDKNNLPKNNIACPQCKNVNPLESKIEQNILYCKSEQCKDQVYCHICQIVLNDENFLNHLDNHNPEQNQEQNQEENQEENQEDIF